jgi:hypothetical protein
MTNDEFPMTKEWRSSKRGGPLRRALLAVIPSRVDGEGSLMRRSSHTNWRAQSRKPGCNHPDRSNPPFMWVHRVHP